MIKIALLTTLLSFSISPMVLSNNTPFNAEAQAQTSQYQLQYYTDYIDLNFFDNLTFSYDYNGEYYYYNVSGTVTLDKVNLFNVYDNEYKYLETDFYQSSFNVSVRNNLNTGVVLTRERSFDTYDNHGFVLVDTVRDLAFNPYYEIIAPSWLYFDGAWSNGIVTYILTINIPNGSNSSGGIGWENDILDLKFFNQSYYDKYLMLSAYVDGYGDGETDGYIDGHNDGVFVGYENGVIDGYNNGYNDGVASDFDAFSWLTSIFSAMGGLLSIQLLPNVSIGGIAILIMVLTLLPFLIGLLKGGKD